MSQVVWQNYQISRTDREQQNGHQGVVVWFTGLSGAGKSTVANALEQELVKRKVHSYLLDGDNVRHGLCADLGFSEADRTENIRRVGAVAGLMLDAGLVVLSAFISPYRAQRQAIKNSLPEGKFLEIYIATSLDVCEQRDVKGLYQKARRGEVSHFTGISDPYEAPEQADLIIDTAQQSLEQSVDQLIALLTEKGVLS